MHANHTFFLLHGPSIYYRELDLIALIVCTLDRSDYVERYSFGVETDVERSINVHTATRIAGRYNKHN